MTRIFTDVYPRESRYNHEDKKTVCLVELGGRANMYMKALIEDFAETCELVALCDINEGRLRLQADWARKHEKELPTYKHDQFDQMLADTHPDVIVVLTKDCPTTNISAAQWRPAATW